MTEPSTRQFEPTLDGQAGGERKPDGAGLGARARLVQYSSPARRATPRRLVAEAVGVLLVAWALYIPYLSQETFIDEWDNIIGGDVVAHGGAIYVDYLSQHMPVAYWVSAIGHLVGADGLAGQRVLGYGVFSLLLALFYFRNAPTFGRIPVLVTVALVPMLHFYNPPLSHTVLSDSYQSILCLFLLYEVVAIGVHGGRPLGRWIVIGLAGAFAVGVAFVSVYFVAGAVVTATVLVAIDGRRSLHAPGRWLRLAATRSAVLGAPFLALIAAVASTGALPAAYEQAYVLNRTYYPKYLGGLGSDAVGPAYQGLVDIASKVGDVATLLRTGGLTGVRNLVALVLLAVLVAVLARVRIALGVGVLWMASLAMTRGWDGFHAQPFWVFMIGGLGIILWLLIASPQSEPRPTPMLLLGLCAAGVVAVLAALPYAVHIYDGRSSLGKPFVLDDPRRDAVITALTPPGLKYADLSIGTARDFVATHRLPAGGFAGVVPWFSDMMDDEMAARLTADRPVLVFSDESTEVWGVNIIGNAPRLAQLLASDYTRVNLSAIGIPEGVYLRNDAVEDSIATLARMYPSSGLADSALLHEVRVCSAAGFPYGEMSDGVTVTQSFMTKGDPVQAAMVWVGNYMHRVSGTLTMEFRSANGSVLGSAFVDLSTLDDNQSAYFTFKEPIPTVPGELYTGEWRTKGTAAGAGIALWGSATDCTDPGAAQFDGTATDGDFRFSYFR